MVKHSKNLSKLQWRPQYYVHLNWCEVKSTHHCLKKCNKEVNAKQANYDILFHDLKKWLYVNSITLLACKRQITITICLAEGQDCQSNHKQTFHRLSLMLHWCNLSHFTQEPQRLIESHNAQTAFMPVSSFNQKCAKGLDEFIKDNSLVCNLSFPSCVMMSSQWTPYCVHIYRHHDSDSLQLELVVYFGVLFFSPKVLSMSILIKSSHCT